MTARILLVEDDDGIAAPLTRALGRDGYDVERVAAGLPALEQLAAAAPDLVILDLGLPDLDGLEVCRQARDEGFAGAIIILTARGDELDRVVGLDMGADDYLSKPFGLAELLARVRSLLRRTQADTPPSSSADGPAVGTTGTESAAGDLRVDDAAHRAWAGDTELSLTTKEHGLLNLLVREAGNAVPRERIMEEVWDEHWFGSTKTLDVTLGRLRQKLTAAGTRAQIVAIRGVGFRLEADA
jgi:DNA-binding response OmpR family regulator